MPSKINIPKDKHALIRMFHVHKRYGAKNALVDVTLEIHRNELIFLSGPSGAGKSTLMRLLYLGEPVSEGQIIVDGANLSRIGRKRVPHLRRKFGIIFQDFKLIHTKTVFENIALVLEALGEKTRQIPKKINYILRTVGMEDRAGSYPPSLSGGEQQRIAVARAVISEPEIILADEPTGNLDEDSAEIIFNLLKRFHENGATVIIATHNKDIIRRTGGRVIYLQQGKIDQEIIVSVLE